MLHMNSPDACIGCIGRLIANSFKYIFFFLRCHGIMINDYGTLKITDSVLESVMGN